MRPATKMKPTAAAVETANANAKALKL